MHIALIGTYSIVGYLTEEGINDTMIYHLSYGVEGSGLGDYYLIIPIAFNDFKNFSIHQG